MGHLRCEDTPCCVHIAPTRRGAEGLRPCSRIAAQRPIGVGVMGVGLLVVVMGVGVLVVVVGVGVFVVVMSVGPTV